jgi:thioredoxin-like negative regulator of GroEL
MIERLLAADRALKAGDIDLASRLFGQVADADPRNAMAVVGLATVALRRGDPGEARRLAVAALAIDRDDAAARRLLDDLGAGPAPTTEPAPPAAPGAGQALGGLLAWLRRLLGRRA